jgi:hypothetical protein
LKAAGRDAMAGIRGVRADDVSADPCAFELH